LSCQRTLASRARWQPLFARGLRMYRDASLRWHEKVGRGEA
jgi:hypothetical protein